MIKNFIKKNLNKDQFDKIVLLYFFFKKLNKFVGSKAYIVIFDLNIFL